MAITRGMKKALAHKASTVSIVKKPRSNIPKRIHPMRTRNSISNYLTDSIDDLEDDDDIEDFVTRLYCAENEILRLSNLNSSLTLKLHNAVETHIDLTARLDRLEALLPPPPPGHPLPIKTEPTEEIN